MTRFQSWVCEPCLQCPSLAGTRVVSPDWRFWAIELHLFIFRRHSPSVSPSGLFPLTLLTTRHEGHVAPCPRQHFVSLICFFFLVTLHSMKDLSSLTREWTCAPCIGSKESQPLDHHGSLSRVLFITAAVRCAVNKPFIAFLWWRKVWRTFPSLSWPLGEVPVNAFPLLVRKLSCLSFSYWPLETVCQLQVFRWSSILWLSSPILWFVFSAF